MMNWLELSSPMIADIGPVKTAIQPIGAIEQHGPHLPVGTDAIVAESVTVEALRRCDFDTLLLPTLSYALSSEHLWAAGTISLGPETLLGVLDDLGRSLKSAGVKRLVFMNGHGGNSALLRVACREIRVRYGLMTFLAHPQVPLDQGGTERGDPEGGFAIHGGSGETSLMLFLRPELVRLEVAERAIPIWLQDYSSVGFGKAVTFGWTSDDFGKSGVIGDPTLASIDNGKILFEAAVNNLVLSLEEITRFEFPS